MTEFCPDYYSFYLQNDKGQELIPIKQCPGNWKPKTAGQIKRWWSIFFGCNMWGSAGWKTLVWTWRKTSLSLWRLSSAEISNTREYSGFKTTKTSTYPISAGAVRRSFQLNCEFKPLSSPKLEKDLTIICRKRTVCVFVCLKTVRLFSWLRFLCH